LKRRKTGSDMERPLDLRKPGAVPPTAGDNAAAAA
jgi:hypothetical protein